MTRRLTHIPHAFTQHTHTDALALAPIATLLACSRLAHCEKEQVPH